MRSLESTLEMNTNLHYGQMVTTARIETDFDLEDFPEVVYNTRALLGGRILYGDTDSLYNFGMPPLEGEDLSPL